MHGRAYWRYAHFFRAIEGDRPDVAFLKIVGAHDVDLRVHQLRA